MIKSQNFQIMQFDSYSKAENAKLNIEKLGIDCDRDDYAYVSQMVMILQRTYGRQKMFNVM